MSTTDDSQVPTPDPVDPENLQKPKRAKKPEYTTEIEPTDPFADFVGDEEQQAVAETAGEQDHEDPWAYADLDGPHSPPSEVKEDES